MAIARAMAAGAASVTQPGTQTKSKGDVLGKDDFLQLLVTQLKYQDAFSGDKSSDQQFIAQMAQFSTLEQMSNLNSTMSQSVRMQTLNQAAVLLGKEVSALDPSSGEMITGKVDSIEFYDGIQVAVVGDVRIPVDSIFKLG